MRILLVDDQSPYRAGLRALLSTVPEFDVVGEAQNGEAAVAEAARLRPDIVLMDVRMPVMNGIAATAAIRARDASACILMLTTFDEDETVADAIRSGAAGYLLKGTPIDDIVEILALAVRGYTALGPGVAQRTAVAHAPEGDTELAERIARVAILSEREREIIACIAQGCTNREVAVKLNLTEGTVKNYVTAILGTLGLRHRTEAALLWRAATQRRGR